ncbi:MAG: hypothetical protein KF819_28745 [Labilithrix sp.]|nr:hypothetical protein [Labilithrix sp.]
MSDKTRRKDSRRSTRPPIPDVRRRSGAHPKVIVAPEAVEGELSRAIAHDLTDLLSVVAACAERAARETDRASEVGADLADIQDAVARGMKLVERLVRGRPASKVIRTPIDVAVRISDFLPILRRLAGPGVRVEHARGPGETITQVDPTDLDRVLAHLVVNARDSMDDGGIVMIRTSRRAHAPPGTRDSTPVFVRITVTDTGRGMDAPTLARAFDPYFTTKRDVRGAGRGLPTVRQIVEDAGGRVWITSAPGGGTEVNVELPPAPIKPSERPPPPRRS